LVSQIPQEITPPGLSKETIEKRDIKLRLIRIANGMERWDMEFELFKKFDVMQSNSKCEWIKKQ
jgi:hypothetical protein